MQTPETRTEQQIQVDQINSGIAPAVEQAPSLPVHETVKADSGTLGDVNFPKEELEAEPDFEDDETEEADDFETVVRIVPTATVYFRAQDCGLQHTLVSVRKHTDEESGEVFDLCNPIASGKRKGKPAGAVGILRKPVTEFFDYLGTVINQNIVFLGSKENCEEYLDRLFVRAESRLAELLYGSEPFLMGEGENTYSIEKTALFSCSLTLSVDNSGPESIAYVNVAINVHVAQLLGAVEKAENVLKMYQKFLQGTFQSAGIETVNIGVVFDVENFSDVDSAAYRLFSMLVGNQLTIVPAGVISKHSMQGIAHEFAFQQNNANTLVMLDNHSQAQVQKV